MRISDWSSDVCSSDLPSPASPSPTTSTTTDRRPGPMKLIVVAVGLRMPEWVETAWYDYAKRLPSDCSLELKEIKPEPRTSGKTPAQMKIGRESCRERVCQYV